MKISFYRQLYLIARKKVKGFSSGPIGPSAILSTLIQGQEIPKVFSRGINLNPRKQMFPEMTVFDQSLSGTGLQIRRHANK
jgi:hypothetical protein